MTAATAPSTSTSAPAARPAPRYIGSQTAMHGDVVDVRPCPLVCCDRVDLWDQPHASLTVVPDAGPMAGRLVNMDRARFASFTGRP